MNTLANHGFLPRDGRNITRDNAIDGLKNGINFNVHNLLEHDASLSRVDAAFGNNRVFNQTVFEESRKWWTDEIITAKQLAHSKIYRQLQSRATNSHYTFSASTEEFSLGEGAASIIVFGDMNTSTVRRDLVEFFLNEKLPTELGWSKNVNEVTLENIMAMTSVIRNATSLLTGPPSQPPDSPHRRRDLHAGFAAASKRAT